MATPRTASHRIVTICGGLGYFAVLMQWLWCLVLFLPALLQINMIHSLITPPAQTESTDAVHFTPPPAIALIIGLAVTATMLIVTIIVIIRMPVAMTKRTKQTVGQSAERLASATVGHHHVTKKKQRLLAARYVLAIKGALALLPLVALIVTSYVNIPLESSIVWAVGLFFVSWSILWFGLQYVVAWSSKLPLEKVY